MLLSRQLIRDLKILRRGGLREQDFLHNKVVFAREPVPSWRKNIVVVAILPWVKTVNPQLFVGPA